MRTITPCLAFADEAEEAVGVYVALFDAVFGDSRVEHTTRFDEKELEALAGVAEMSDQIMPKPGVKTIRFVLAGQEVLALNGGGYFGKFHESMSLYVSCETQEEIDALWTELSRDCLAHQPCGWIKDRFGVSWQIVPSFVWDVDEGTDRAKAERMNVALFAMTKVDIAELRKVTGVDGSSEHPERRRHAGG